MSVFEHYTDQEGSKILEDFMVSVKKNIDDRMSMCEKDSEEYKKTENEKLLIDLLIKSTRISGLESIVYLQLVKDSADLLSKLVSFLNNNGFKDSPIIMRAMIDTIAIIGKIPDMQRSLSKDKKEVISALEKICQTQEKKFQDKSNLIDINSILNKIKSNQ